MDVLAVVATGAELAVLAPALARVESMVCGVGPLEAGLALGRRLERGPVPDLLVSLGIGGGFAAAGAGLLDICVADREALADLGVGRGPDVVPFDGAAASPWRFAAPGRLVDLAVRSLPAGTLVGAFVTVGAVTASAARADALWKRHAPVCENMEGAAVARAAEAFGVDWLEVRAVSNPVGPRDRAAWRTDEALERLAACVPGLLAALGETLA